MSALEYTQRLVAYDTVSRNSNVEITDDVESILRDLGCVVERVEYEDAKGVAKSNVMARLGPVERDGLAYFGHTDVVPADDWRFTEHGPFEPTVRDGRLYGRGSCDMKGSVSCMLAAIERVDATKLQRPIYFTCTADEEVGYGGARHVVEQSELYREMVETDARGIIGEPTLLDVVHAHKGGHGIIVTSHGKSAHSSTREGLNANLAMIPFLAELKALHDETEADPQWQNDEFDPPTVCMNIGVNDYTRALNVKPAQSRCTAYYRIMPNVDGEAIFTRIEEMATRHGLDLDVIFKCGAMYTPPDSEYVATLCGLAGRESSRTVGYGTDGGAFTQLEHRIVYGPGSIAQAHTHDEWIALEQLEAGTDAYEKLIAHFCL